MRAVSFSVSAKQRLTHHDLDRFPGDTLFARIARAVCAAGVLPRKELHEALVTAWPRLAGRVHTHAVPLDTFPLAAGDVVVSSHACGALTDLVLETAAAARAAVAVLPCCHDVETCHAGPLTGWMDAPLAIDARRALRLEQHGYRVWTQTIPAAITPKNRLLLGVPAEATPAGGGAASEAE